MLSSRRQARDDAANGQVLVLFALFLVVLIGATAIAIDYGSWLKVRRDYQNIADAAVLAGSVYLTRPIDGTKQAQARLAAWKSIEDQLGLALDEAGLSASNTAVGSPVTSGGFRLWVSTPPIGGPVAYPGNFAGSTRVLFAWIERDSPAFFSRIFGQGDPSISAWASSGTFPNRFAIITLRKNGMSGATPKNIDINGGTVVRVLDGDVGGNWGLAVNGSGSQLRMGGSTGDPYGVFLTENVSGTCCGNNWSPGQVVDDSTGNPIPVNFHAEVADPNYPAPCGGNITFSATIGAAGCLEDRTAVYGVSHRTTAARSVDTCTLDPLAPAGPANDRLPTGRYQNIRVDNDECLVFDPTFDQKAGRQNGIVYITGTLDVNNGGLVLGDGVTLVFARGARLNMNAGATISLNRGSTTNNPFGAAACGGNPTGSVPNNCRFAAWTAKAGGGGQYTWGTGVSTTYSTPSDSFERGMAAYVCKSAADCDSNGTPSTDILQLNSGAGIDWRGLVYAPYDNVKLAGQPGHQDIGQLVSWTVQFTGGSEITQTFDGPDQAVPVLLEPRLGQ